MCWWDCCQARVLRFNADADLTRQINPREKKIKEGGIALSNVYTRCVPILITDTLRKYKSRDNAVICLSSHTHDRAHTLSRKDSTMLMWHLSVPRGCGWDYACVRGWVKAVWKEVHYRFTTQREATRQGASHRDLLGMLGAPPEGKHTQYGGASLTADA